VDNSRMSFFELLNFYYGHLMYDIIPFWVHHAIDWEDGGIFTDIADDGTLLSTDKFIWSNARALYTFSSLYNYIEPEQKWLDIARNIFTFCANHGRTKQGVWGYLSDKKGGMLEGEKAIQVDAFAIMGMTEYARATGDERAKAIAVETFESTRSRLANPGSYGTFPYPIPEGAKAHRDHFQFAFAYFMLGSLLGREDILSEAYWHAEEVMDHFRRPERGVLVEYVSVKNTFMDTPAGRIMNIGHTIESMWFLMHLYRRSGNRERISQAIETIRLALEKGWDPEYGGLFLAIDIEGKTPVYWKHADKKLWWVFSETLYALLLAYEESRQAWCMDWYWKIHDWAFTHFPVPVHGEWTQKLNQDGSRFDGIVALPVKDPFHLPRALVMCIDVLRRINGKNS